MSKHFETLVELFEHATQAHALRPLFGTKRAEGWEWMRYDEFGRDVDACRGGLAQLSIKAGDRVAIVSDNRVEWAVLAYATYGLSGIVIPIYEAQSPEDRSYILKDSGAKLVLAATESLFDELENARPSLPELAHVIGLGQPASDPRSFRNLIERGKKAPTPIVHPRAEDPATYLYTSGTTGEPKGVVLSHANIVSNLHALSRLFPLVPDDRSLAFLPWAHAFGQTGELHKLMSAGCSIAINDQVPNLLENLAEIRPTILVAVPRIFNRIYDRVNAQMAERPAFLRSLFQSALSTATRRSRGEPVGALDAFLLAVADRLIFTKIRKRVGGRLKYAVSGSAALSREVGEFVNALGIDVYEGYGLTETSPVLAVNYPGHKKIGSVGKALPGVRLVIDTKATGDPEKGEIVAYGPCVMRGYHHRPEETKAVLTPDGGIRTGDMGHLDADGFLFITGRIKEQYKLETGKYVVPSPLEERLKLSPYIANVMLYGDNKPHNVALVVPDLDALGRWAQKRGKTLEDPTRDPELKKLIQQELEKHAEGFKSYEKPLGFSLLEQDFTVENGMLTLSLKVKRNVVLDRYRALLESLY